MYFVNLSIITKIKSNLFFVIEFSDFNSFVIKFIIIESYNLSNILANLIYLYSEYLATLFCWQTMQLLIYAVILSLNLGKK